MEVDQVPGASEGAGDTGETTESAAELKAKLHSEVLNHIDQNSQNGYSSANDESSRQADSSNDHRDKDRHSSKHHSSPDKHKHSNSSSDKHKHSSSSDKHRSSSDKHHSSSSSKHKDGSSSSHKHSSSSSHRTSSDKHKDGHSSSSSSKHREGGSSSSKDKHSHSSSSKDKHPSSSSSNKHSSSSDKHSSSSDKHSSSSDKHKHSSSDKHKHSSSDKHKHSSSSSKHKESSDKHKDRSSEHRDKDKHSSSSSKHKDSSRSHSSHKHINSKKENVDVDNDEQRQLEKERQAEKIKLEAEMREAHENGMSEDLDQLSPERLPSSPVKSTIKEEPESSDDDEDVPLSVRLKQETVVKPMKQEVDMKPVKRQLEESDDDDDDEPLAVRKEKVKKVKRETPEPKSIKRKVEESESEDERPVPKKKQKKKVKAEVKEESVSPKKKAKKGKAEEPTVWKWWEEDKQDSLVKWNFLEHKGPVFAPPYERLPKNVKFYYDGKPMILSEDTEEVATFYGKMLEHDYTTKDVFNSNFMKCWRKEMNAEEREKLTDLKKCNFREMCEYFKEESEKRKTRSKEQRLKLKEENQQLMDEYGYCTMDGHKEKIGNFRIEPPGLFRGRGEHPKQGMLKKRTVAKDIIINCSKDSVIPQPPKGHKWKRVQFDNKVTWLASWNENIQGSTKYVMLNASSRLKGEKDWQKYETARHLHRCVDKIRANYQQNWRSKEMRIRQRSVALYFIDKLALRAGNEKEEGESADTVGCCSLRVEHVSLFPEKDGKQFVVQFDFLGKDSIRYVNTVAVEKQVYKNLQMFTENKQPGDDLFDRLNTVIMNKHLHELMDGLTAKVFRTYNASRTLQEQLDIMTNEEDPVTAKMLSYNRANRAVAILCNHQRAAPKNFSTQMENIMGKIKEKRGHVKEAKKQLKEAKANFKAGKNQKNKMVYEKKKKALERIEEQLTKLEVQATDKDENKEIALGTSKLNYLDPRISVAWCKKWEVPIEKVYNKTQRDKFRWAIDMVGPEFHF